MGRVNRALSLRVVLLLVTAAAGLAQEKTASAGTGTQVVMLGTGTPLADPERSGPAAAGVVNGAAYLVDCGPGVVRRGAGGEKKRVKAVARAEAEMVFRTAPHS